MRTTTLPLLMGLISALAHAQETGGSQPTNPSVNPAPLPTAPSTGVAPPPPPVAQSSGTGSGSAGGESSPFVFGIRQGLTGDSNLFRAPDGSPLVRRDRIWSSGIHLGIDKPLGRQRFLVDVEANHNRYNKNEHLNNTDYSALARWDWETVGRLAGQLSAQQRQSLYRDTIDGAISLERNQLRTTSVGFNARLGLVTVWSLEGGVAASESNYLGGEVDDRDMRQTAVNLGVRYRPTSAFTGGVGLRRSEGRYPRLASGPDEFTRDDLDLTARLAATGASEIDARLSATREEHSAQASRDNSGWTGALGWRWRPTGKLSTNLDLSHDRSVGRSAFESPLIGDETSDTTEADRASLSIVWDATAKVSFVPRVSWVRRKLDNSFTTGGTVTATGTDTTVVGGLTLNYTPFDALTLICQVTQERRRVGGAAVLSTPYTATVAGCNAEFALR